MTSFYIPYITLKNNHNDIVYHRIREYVAAGVISLTHITGKYNPYYLLANNLAPHQHCHLMKEFLFKYVSDLMRCHIVRVKLSCSYFTSTNRRLYSDTRGKGLLKWVFTLLCLMGYLLCIMDIYPIEWVFCYHCTL